MVCQLGGASGNGFVSAKQREAANDALKKKGEFKNGVFSYVDNDGKRHNQDGSEACLEEATGRKLTFAKPRYEDLVIMDPSAYEWISDTTPGVSHKLLGSFTERNTRIGFIRIDKGAQYAGGVQDSIEALFLVEGNLTLNGTQYGRHSAFEFLPGEGPISLKANESTQLLRIIMPKF